MKPPLEKPVHPPATPDPATPTEKPGLRQQRLSDLQGATRLATSATVALASLVEALHARIASAPGIRGPDQTSGITGFVYRSVRGVTRLVGGSADLLLQALTPLLQTAAPDEARHRRSRAVPAIPWAMPRASTRSGSAASRPIAGKPTVPATGSGWRSEAMSVFLIETDDAAPTRIETPPGPVRIGKHRDNELVLPSWRVARVHAEIVRIDGGWRLHDRGSIGGTWVNGERIVEYGPLAPADEIQIAGYRIRMESGSGLDVGVETATSGDSDDVSADAMRTVLDPAPSDPMVEWRRAMHRRLLQAIDLRRRDVRQLSEQQLRSEARVLVVELMADEPDLPPELDRERLVEDVLAEAIGLGPLEGLMGDPAVSEIMVNSPAEIFVERAGRLERVPVMFTGEPALRAVIDRIVAPLGRRVDEASPMVDARLPDGSRVNAIVPPLAVRGTSLTIRRFGKRLLRPDDLVSLGSASAQMLAFLRVCVAGRRNIVISGGTGSGKTTLLNVLSNLIDDG